MKIITFISYASLAICVLIGFFHLLDSAMDRSEVFECTKWKVMSEQYEGFYITHWQNDQCNAHDIVINAPIK